MGCGIWKSVVCREESIEMLKGMDSLSSNKNWIGCKMMDFFLQFE
jgi:hypothetical protein